MKRYLLDTSVLSLLAPSREGVPPALSNWFRTHADQLYVSTITVAEIQQGISKLRRSGGEQRADLLSAWLKELTETGADQIVPFDAEAALKAGQISDAAMAKGRHLGFANVGIAAVAVARDMTLLTTNGRHFEPLGVEFVDPSAMVFADAS